MLDLAQPVAHTTGEHAAISTLRMDPSNEIQLFRSCLLGRRNSEPAVGRIVVALVTFEEPRGSDDPRVSSKIVGGGHLTAHPARP